MTTLADVFCISVAVFPAVGPACIDFISLKDVGSCLLTILENPKVFESKTVALSGDKLTGRIVTKILNDELYPMKFVQKQVYYILKTLNNNKCQCDNNVFNIL